MAVSTAECDRLPSSPASCLCSRLDADLPLLPTCRRLPWFAILLQGHSVRLDLRELKTHLVGMVSALSSVVHDIKQEHGQKARQ